MHYLLQPEMMDFVHILEMGAEKYEAHGWLMPDGACTSHKEMFSSMFRHLAEANCGITQDHESRLDPLLHLATRALMMYTRRQRSIQNSKD